MILISGLYFKSLNQENYNKVIENIKKDLDEVIFAVFGHHERFIFYGSYHRTYTTDQSPNKSSVKIQRIRSLDTGKTHALIPTCLVPYSTTPLEIQVEIIEADEEDLPAICEEYSFELKTLRHIRQIFQADWKRDIDWFIFSFDLLVMKSIKLFHRQFMQTRGFAFLHSPT